MEEALGPSGHPVHFSCSVVSNSLRPHGLQHARLPSPPPPPGACLNSVHWVNDAIQPSHPVVPFSSFLQSFPASGSFPVNWLFTTGSQSFEASASASVLPMNIQDWSPLGLTGLIPDLVLYTWLKIKSSWELSKNSFPAPPQVCWAKMSMGEAHSSFLTSSKWL